MVPVVEDSVVVLVVDELGRVTVVVDELPDLLPHPLRTTPVNRAAESRKDVPPRTPRFRRMVDPPLTGRLS
jgi:hypothetical protein